MSAEHDEHAETETETESEDGGIPLAMSTSKAESDEVDIDTGSDVTPASHGSGASSSSSANELGEMLTSPVDDFTGHGNLTAEYQQPSAIFNEIFNHPMISPFSVPQAASSTTSTSISEAPHGLEASFAFGDAGFATVDQDQHLLSMNGDTAGVDQLNALANNILLSNDSQLPNTFPPHHWSVPSETPQASTDPLSTATDNVTPMDHSEAPVGTSENETVQNVSQNLPQDHTVSTEPIYLTAPYNEDMLGLSDESYNIFSADTAQENGMLHTLNQASNMVSYYDHDDLDEAKNLTSVSFFLYHWKQMYMKKKPDYPSISSLANHGAKVQRPDKLTVEDGDQHDYQGIHWTRFQTTKQEAREVRRMTYRNIRNVDQPEELNYGTKAFKANFPGAVIPSSDCYFRFNEMDMNRRPDYGHYQLRHNLSATSKNAIFYTCRPRRPDTSVWDAWGLSHKKIACFNPETGTESCALDVNKRFSKEDPKIAKIHTLTAGNGVLVAGSHEGVYAMKSLSADFESAPVFGEITAGADVSTNHIQTYLDRQSGLPRVVFDSNDWTVRILDCTTSHWVACHKYPYQVNCSVISPDGRLRLLNGDGCEPIVANAETGEMLARLPGHEDFGFACDWAADGVTMATGHQDGIVKVWDARKLNQSIQTIAMEQAGCRSLQFSPLGSGKRVLVLAEPADFVHIVDARTFDSRQTIDFFGEISGISMPPDGSNLYIANADPKYGGLMEFMRSHDGTKYNRRPFPVAELENEHEEMVDLIVDGVQPVQWFSDIGDKLRERVEPFMHRQGMPFAASSMVDETIVHCESLFNQYLREGGGRRVTATGRWANIARQFGIPAEKAASCGRELYNYWQDNLAPYELSLPFAPIRPITPSFAPIRPERQQTTTGRDVSGSVASRSAGAKGRMKPRRDLDCGEERGYRGYWRDYDDPRRKGFKIGRKSESLDWLSESEIEDEGRVKVPKGQGRRQWASRLEIDDDDLLI